MCHRERNEVERSTLFQLGLLRRRFKNVPPCLPTRQARNDTNNLSDITLRFFTINRMLRFYIYKFGQFCVHHLPLFLAYRIANILSDLHYYFSFRDRRFVKNNLKIILQSQENIPFLAREVFRNFGKYLVDFFRMQKTLDGNYIKQFVKIKNIERFEEALRKKKGAIMLTAHIGNWELGAAVLSLLGYPVVAVVLPHKERPVNDLFNDQRQTWGITIVSSNGALRKCLESLKEGKLVALVADRDFTSSGLEMDFLNKKALIPKGAAVFCAKTGAPIIPIFFIRNGDDSFTLEFEELIYSPEIQEDTVSEEVLLAIMKKYTAVIENKIRQYPTQWLMFREFWIK